MQTCKNIKIKHFCKDCQLQFTRYTIVFVDKVAKPSEIKEALEKQNITIGNCPNCTNNNFEVYYSFYHEEKVK
jgi:Zn finger protein HypA/HybF involved in hydrogenase expression